MLAKAPFHKVIVFIKGGFTELDAWASPVERLRGVPRGCRSESAESAKCGAPSGRHLSLWRGRWHAAPRLLADV